jgi:hypothetical protein
MIKPPPQEFLSSFSVEVTNCGIRQAPTTKSQTRTKQASQARQSQEPGERRSQDFFYCARGDVCSCMSHTVASSQIKEAHLLRLHRCEYNETNTPARATRRAAPKKAAEKKTKKKTKGGPFFWTGSRACKYIYIYTGAHTPTHAHAHAHAHAHIHRHVHMHVCVRIQIDMHVHLFAHVRT